MKSTRVMYVMYVVMIWVPKLLISLMMNLNCQGITMQGVYTTKKMECIKVLWCFVNLFHRSDHVDAKVGFVQKKSFRLLFLACHFGYFVNQATQ